MRVEGKRRYLTDLRHPLESLATLQKYGTLPCATKRGGEIRLPLLPYFYIFFQ